MLDGSRRQWLVAPAGGDERGSDGPAQCGRGDQDLSIGTSQQQGLNSRGFKGCLLPLQEKRVQRFHELLNDMVAGT